MASALYNLSLYCEERHAYEEAIGYVRRQLQLDPLQEESHRRLMHLLFLNGQRSAALAQYDICRRLLLDELRVGPERRTTELYEKIRDGEIQLPAAPALSRGSIAVGHPLDWPGSTGAVPPPAAPIVARDSEMSELDCFLQRAVSGQGQLVFVTGETGAGKTALVQAFLQRAMQTQRDLMVAEGQCNAYTGAGDPYLPFGEIIRMLTGDIEAKRAAGNVTPDHARRLWTAFPIVLQAMVDMAPDCIDLLLPGEALLARARAFAGDEEPWLPRLQELAQRRPAPSPDQRHADFFGEYTGLMQALARQFPLVLVLDDLQWADMGSIGLLFHLARRLAGSRILIIGAFRREDLALGRAGDRHPLESIINELQRDLGDIVIDLDKVDGRQFINELLDREPNRLSTDFRDTLYRHTAGQPLFTVELLHGLQERGDLIKDKDGYWIEHGDLSWDRLPARAEAVIAERLGRLPARWRTILTAASVEGEEFTAEVIARVLQEDESEIRRGLSTMLTSQNMVHAVSLERIGGQRLRATALDTILCNATYTTGSTRSSGPACTKPSATHSKASLAARRQRALPSSLPGTLSRLPCRRARRALSSTSRRARCSPVSASRSERPLQPCPRSA